jgi:hypothetical protein
VSGCSKGSRVQEEVVVDDVVAHDLRAGLRVVRCRGE